jgi:hypothetical protein
MIAYALQPNDIFMGTCNQLLLHDLATDPEELHIQALVASGDYFETLAATLEQIALALPASSLEQYQLQHVIGTLLYLQTHYTIAKK